MLWILLSYRYLFLLCGRTWDLSLILLAKGRATGAAEKLYLSIFAAAHTLPWHEETTSFTLSCPLTKVNICWRSANKQQATHPQRLPVVRLAYGYDATPADYPVRQCGSGEQCYCSDVSFSSLERWRAAARNASAIAVISPSSLGSPLKSELSAARSPRSRRSPLPSPRLGTACSWCV